MSRRPSVAVLDYGSGNVHSAVRALDRAGAEVELTQDTDTIRNADGLVVPGVGAFAAVMDALKAIDAPRWIGQRIAGNRPVLGICVGHQILFERGVEHGIAADGMGEWPGEVTALPSDVVVPHMGWNTVTAAEGSTLFAGIEQERFYFVHSYAVQSWDFDQSIESMNPPKVTWSHHGADFIAAVENGPLAATQFHPEKSGEAGTQLLRNWITSL
ncbi:imidazole glycerol phosphate synthase subunit HisH [Nesterenkonia ebinurensis]|uniref:imidazole glycerol phosphate synthase subunit HisH n=1 Tax=Nesterenkonia ebinurensis TaxID=2608252 RepID=UPI00123DABC7|nr:imidazole glycerol phosphate synthase subunit HisH [Nesterenkonia ebinurensis]